MVKGQVFKNYKELCAYMGETEVNGNAKIAQFKKWSGLFECHKQGHKIIIDEVYENGEMLEPFGGYDTHIKIMLPYVRSKILSVDPDEYLGTQRLLGTAMRLIPMAAYKQINDRGMKSEAFYKKHGLQEVGSFEEYVSVAGQVMKDTVVRCLRRMQKNREIKFTEAEVFIAKDGRRRYLCLDGYDELVKKVEYDVCNELALELGLRTKGRQLIHYIKGRKELMQRFYTRCMEKLLKDESLMRDLTYQYKLITGRKLKPEIVEEYYKVIHIIDYDEERIKKARGPDYDEKKQLKLIYEDIKPRIAGRLSVSKKDISKIEQMLFG
jgi:hypothetical protein